MRMAVVAMSAAGLLGCTVALADRVVGIAGIPPARTATAKAPAVAPTLQSGVVSSVSVNDLQIEISGKRYLLKPGRSLVLRDGLPVAASTLTKGQKVDFSLASATPGEQALGVVHVR